MSKSGLLSGAVACDVNLRRVWEFLAGCGYVLCVEVVNCGYLSPDEKTFISGAADAQVHKQIQDTFAFTSE
jgi:hypothetical protein